MGRAGPRQQCERECRLLHCGNSNLGNYSIGN